MTKEEQQGYNDAIEAIKKAMQNNGRSSNGSGSNNGMSLPPELEQPNDSNGSKDDKQSGSRGSGSNGVVRPEDCAGQSFGSDQPGTAGTFGDREEGKKLAKSEGYDDNGPSDEQLEKDWKEASIKNAPKLRGNNAGGLKSKINDIWKTTTDWRKQFKDIIGHSLNPDTQDWRFTNKNTLVTQNRMARTDKDKFDNVDYIAIFIDSSGSMSDDQLGLVLSEVYALALQKKPLQCVVIQCDTQIQEIKIYKKPDEIKKEFKSATVKGRGGTILKPCWDLLRTDKRFNKRRADCVLCFTDGECEQYPRDPKTMSHFVWVFLDNPDKSVQYNERFTKSINLKTSTIQ